MTQGSFISWSIAVAVLAVAPCLRAQEAKPSLAADRREAAPVGAVRVDIATGEDDLLLTVAQPGKQQAVVSCHHQCSFWGAPGSYTLLATSPARGIQYETTLDVEQRSQFKVSSGDPDVRTVGLVAGIVGPLAVVGGAILGVRQGLAGECAEPTCPTRTNYLPAVLILGGLVTTVAGWALFSAGGPSVDPIEEPTEGSRAPHPQLGVLALPRGGWGLGLSTLF